jgi:hypothetical protein
MRRSARSRGRSISATQDLTCAGSKSPAMAMDLIGSVMFGEESADGVERDGAEILDSAHHFVMVWVAGREKLVLKDRTEEAIGVIFEPLAPLVDNDFALVIEVVLSEILEKESEGIGLRPQVAFEAAGGDGGAEFGEVDVEIPAEVGGAETFQFVGERVAVAVFGEQVLHQVGEAALAGLFVVGAGADAEVDVDDGDFAIDMEKEIESVREGGAVDGEVGLGGGQQGDEEGEGSGAEHRGHVIARRTFGGPPWWLTGANHAATRNDDLTASNGTGDTRFARRPLHSDQTPIGGHRFRERPRFLAACGAAQFDEAAMGGRGAVK